MLNAPDLAGFDLPALLSLGARLEAAALHQDRCRRQAARFEIPAGFVGTAQSIEEPHELAAAMGFNDEERRYEFTGTKTEQVKQIGNAVSVAKMRACVAAIMADAAQDRGDSAPLSIAAE